MVAKLIAEEGDLKGLTLSFQNGDRWIVGRDPDACQLLIEDPAISRKHLLCVRTPDGITVQNLSETNPVLINEQPLEDTRLLHSGDVIKMGNGTFRYIVDDTEEAKKPEEVPAVLEEESTIAEPPESKEEAKSVAESTLESMVPAAPSPKVAEPAAEQKEPKHPSIYDEEAEIPSDQAKIAEINFDILETGRWLLKVVSGPNNGAEFSMASGKSYVIGTDPNTCDIVFHDTSVSRQHARLTISTEDQISIEDLKSRNGTFINGTALQGKEALPTNAIIAVGTTSFVIYDREGNMQTIISPLLPSIVKVLQKEEAQAEEKSKEETPPAAALVAPVEPVKPKKGSGEKPLGAFILIALITGLFVIVGIGATTLFKSQPIVSTEPTHVNEILAKALNPFPSIKYSFNKNTGKLFLVGHVLTASDKNQLLYNLQGIPFIKSLDDSGIIIDEYIWQELNVVLNKNPNWRGITLQTPTPGQFVLTGYLPSRKEADLLYDYIASNFPYLDRLEKRVYVTEDMIQIIDSKLLQKGFNSVKVLYQYGEVSLSGSIPKGSEKNFQQVVDEISKLPGVRSVTNHVQEAAAEASVVNISDRYEVTGYSSIGNKLSVVINGRIVTAGDSIDGMSITKITPNAIFLEKEGIKYRIDFAT